MGSNANALATLLYSFTGQPATTGEADIADATSNEKQWIAMALTQAIQEQHRIAPDLWRRRPGITLVAPISGTATVTNGSDAVTLGTLTIPNDGCTVRFSSGMDNEINAVGDGSYKLRRPHDGLTGTLSATLWHDCWMSADGITYANVLGDVLANGRKIAVGRTLDEVELCRLRYGYRDYGIGPSAIRLRFAGTVLAVVFEPWASPFASKQIQTRLRFTPMPAMQTVIDANLQAAAQVVSVADILATGGAAVTFQTPAHLDESLLLPIALKKWSLSPFFRTDSSRKGIDEGYSTAIDSLRSWRGQQDAIAGIEVPYY